MSRISSAFLPRSGRSGGFTLIEALLGIALLGIAMLSLAQIFLFSIRNNMKSGEISQSVYLAQQQIDYLRALTATELNGFPSTARGESSDETIDVNKDGTVDYRRLTKVTFSSSTYVVQVLIFPPNQLDAAAADLVADPAGHSVRANMNTVISR